MGLDSVELLLEVEETFDIRIPDEEAAGILTVGQLHNSILKKMRGGSAKTSCGSQKAFCKLRQTLIDHFGADRRETRTRTSTEDMFPRENRKELWKRFGEYIEFRTPELVRPAWLVRVLYVFIFALMALCVIIGIGGHVLVSTSLFLSAVYLLVVSTRPLAIEFPSDCQTLGGLARSLLQRNYGRLYEGGHSDAEVWDILCCIISEQLGVTKEELNPETNFVKDLNLN